MLSKCRRAILSQFTYHKLRQFSSALPPSKERKLKVLDAEINVIETTENGPDAPAIFYLPGAFGSIEMDFKPILHELNREKYKWISWDPPGYGKSRPPKRDFVSQHCESVNVLDVKYIKEIMNIIGYPKYTLAAWSGGALSGVIIAADQPERVSALITWGAFGYVEHKMMSVIKVMKNIGLDGIPEPRKSQLLNMYGEDYLLEMWNGWCDEAIIMMNSDKFKEGGTYQGVLSGVQCPALIIHGMKDSLVDFSQAQYLNASLKNSRLHVMPNGTHNLHLRETKEFVQCIQQFVDDVSSHVIK